MKNLARFLVPAAALLLFAGCKSDTSTAAAAGGSSAKPYPLDVCIVSDEKLGSMGDAVVFVHDGQEVKLCCDSCRKDFDKEPAKFLAKLAGK